MKRTNKACKRGAGKEVEPFVNKAMLGAFILSMPERPDVERLTEYYAKAMMTGAMKWYCRQSGKSKFSTKDIENMRSSAKRKAADRNPYS